MYLNLNPLSTYIFIHLVLLKLFNFHKWIKVKLSANESLTYYMLHTLFEIFCLILFEKVNTITEIEPLSEIHCCI